MAAPVADTTHPVGTTGAGDYSNNGAGAGTGAGYGGGYGGKGGRPGMFRRDSQVRLCVPSLSNVAYYYYFSLGCPNIITVGSRTPARLDCLRLPQLL